MTPVRIWAYFQFGKIDEVWTSFSHEEYAQCGNNPPTEYVRADIVAEKDVKIAELEAKIDGLLNGTQQIEIVLNKCYGGFGLSEKALKLYEHYSGKTNVYYNDIPRHSRHLVRVVKELGDEANTRYSQLAVETITLDQPYRIYEHAGKERLEY